MAVMVGQVAQVAQVVGADRSIPAISAERYTLLGRFVWSLKRYLNVSVNKPMNTKSAITKRKEIYKKGDRIIVTRSGSNENISGVIKEIHKDIVWGYFLAEIEQDDGRMRLITTETDTIL